MAYTLRETIGTPSGAGSNFGHNYSTTYIATQWQAGASYTLTQIGLSLKRVGTPSTGTITGKVWVDNGSTDPDSTTIITSTNTVNLADLTDTYTEYLFQFASGMPITSGNLYWLGGQVSVINVTHYANWQYGGYLVAHQSDQSTNGTTWSALVDRRMISWTYSTSGSDRTPAIVPVVLTGIAPHMNFGIVTRSAIRGG